MPEVKGAIKGDGMLLEDAGGVIDGLKAVQDDKLAALQPKLHVLVAAAVHQLRQPRQVAHLLPIECLAPRLFTAIIRNDQLHCRKGFMVFPAILMPCQSG